MDVVSQESLLSPYSTLHCTWFSHPYLLIDPRQDFSHPYLFIRRSSRSHTIFRLVIESSAAENFEGDSDSESGGGSISGNAITVSHLNLVDLAGYETDLLFLKHACSTIRQSSYPACGFSMMDLG